MANPPPPAGPRETARQIAEQVSACIDGDDLDPTSLNLDDATDVIAAGIEAHVASLTADLAQARQEHNQAVERQMLALDAKFDAEQARDEALKVLERAGYRRCDIPACNCGSWHNHSSAARTALLTAAAIADEWAESHSCNQHDDNPCCHVRTGAGIAAKIRASADPLPRAQPPEAQPTAECPHDLSVGKKGFRQ